MHGIEQPRFKKTSLLQIEKHARVGVVHKSHMQLIEFVT